jgi:hypothetical protein
VKTIAIAICVFKNKKTQGYKWLSLESVDGGSGRYLYESSADTMDQPSQKPSDVTPRPATLVDYEGSVNRICEDGYDIVTRR